LSDVPAGPTVGTCPARGPRRIAFLPQGGEVDPGGATVLKAPMEQPDRTQSRRQLLVRAWDLKSEVVARIKTRTVDMHIQRLRTKLGDAGDRSGGSGTG
jgi:DNA-binding response OmpR family regulator